ncbi:SusC/RagA family TonB-linked outer membrane protein [Chitinophaga sp. S165]|uniref:SusC/RagA family TonB-linked outer membrane protein n=1 Tax=Chitinophaga sp. S165 TaxID=2135462 RepID=UPI001304A4B7|nr:SusC/RagA family TonB-linked outer membrane protein [Chitinophaga sp. S165]
MKLLILFTVAGCLQAGAKGFSQGINLSMNNANVKEVFDAIAKQSGYRFLYTTETLAGAKKVSIKISNKSITEALDICMEDQPFSYNIVNKKYVVIKRKEVPAPAKEVGVAPPGEVRGRVTDDKGQPVVGASVRLSGTSRTVTTDANGEFSINGVSGKGRLEISSVGYESKEIAVQYDKPLAISLNKSFSLLDESVVVAYGTTTRRKSVGNIEKVKAVDIERQPVNNPLLTLQGRVPGVMIEQTTGVSGGGIKVRIQGQNSLSSGSEPLYVIDGIPFVSSESIRGLTSPLGNSGNVVNGISGSGNPLNFINPHDIESIEVLKDADATSIYGSRAAAGALLITTKKGKGGVTKVDLNFQHGRGNVSRFLKLLNTTQYLEMRHEALRNDGIVAGPSDNDINGTWDTTRYTDWQKELFGGTAIYNDGQIAVSGGGNGTSFLLSVGYNSQSSVFPGDFKDRRNSVHANMNHQSLNGRLRIGMDIKYMTMDNRLPGIDLVKTALALAPHAPALFLADGSLNWAPDKNNISTWRNPLANLLSAYKLKGNSVIANATFGYQLIQGLEFKSNLGYTQINRREVSLFPLEFYVPENRASSIRSTNFGDDDIVSVLIEPQLTYKKGFPWGDMETFIGATYLDNRSNRQDVTARGFSSNLLMEDFRSATSITGNFNNVSSNYRYSAVFGRLNYGWRGKYLLSATVRRDGSSRFGTKNLFNNFWSLGGGWVFTEESLLKDKLPVLTYGKLKISFGTTGSDQIGDYQYLNLYNSVSRTVPYQTIVGLSSSGYPNPYLQWEETKKLQSGIELGLLSNRLLLDIAFYYNRSFNQLQTYALPIITGSSGFPANFPAIIQNTGLEFSANSDIVQQQHFRWNSAINITIPRNKLVSYQNLSTSTRANFLRIGDPFTVSRLYEQAGVDPQTGLYTFVAADGSITSTPTYAIDATQWINTSPILYGGIQNTISLKSFTFDANLQFVTQRALNMEIGNMPGFFASNTSGFILGNQPEYVMDRWRKPGDVAKNQQFSALYPAAISAPYSNSGLSSAIYQDASYLRLKNVSIAWQMPASYSKVLGVAALNVFIRSQNTFTITNYKGLDPETRGPYSSAALPPLRVFTFGIHLSL